MAQGGWPRIDNKFEITITIYLNSGTERAEHFLNRILF